VERDEGDDFGVSRTTLVGVIRRFAFSRSTYVCLLIVAGLFVGVYVELSQVPSETITVSESGSLGASVSYVISGKTPYVVDTEKQMVSGASSLRTDGINITTMDGDTHVGAHYCQYTIPETEFSAHITVYSTSAQLGNTTCANLQSLGFF
jgi:hypothetical protein